MLVSFLSIAVAFLYYTRTDVRFAKEIFLSGVLFFRTVLQKDDIMSTKEKQATPKAAFVFLVPLAKEQPAQQAGKRVSAGS